MGGFIGSRAKGARGAWLYSLGSLAAGLVYQAFNSWAQLYYVDVLKMPLALYGTAMTFYGIWNAINDPLAGQWSDMTSTRWGRRIPFILFGTVPMCLAFIMVWAVPPAALATPGRLFAYFVITVFLFDGLYSMVVLNWTALYPEMYPELAQRSSVSAIKQALGIVGMVVGMVLAPQFRAALGWTGMGIAFAIMGAAAIRQPRRVTGGSPLQSGPEPRHSAGPQVHLHQQVFRDVCHREPACAVHIRPRPGRAPFYSKYVIGASDAQNTLILAPMFVVALPMVWAWAA